MCSKNCFRIFLPSIRFNVRQFQCVISPQSVLKRNKHFSTIWSSSTKFNYLKIQNTRVYSKSTTKFPIKLAKDEIYYGILTPQIRAVKLFSLLTSVTGLAAQPFLYKAVLQTLNVPIVVAVYSFVGFFTFVTPILLHFVTKKYITNLSYNKETNTYTATTLNVFNMRKKTEFKVEDVIVPEIPGMFTTFVVKNKSFFLDPKMFDDPSHYGRIMGYDKPFDMKLYQTSLNEKTK